MLIIGPNARPLWSGSPVNKSLGKNEQRKQTIPTLALKLNLILNIKTKGNTRAARVKK